MAIAKWIVAFVAVYGFGGVLADFVVPTTARMHMKNPAWPVHAKFHNSQTMLMGVFAGTLSLCCLFAVHPLTLPWFFAGTAAASLYWAGLVFAQLFPGTAWHDPEFDAEVSHPLGSTRSNCSATSCAFSLSLLWRWHCGCVEEIQTSLVSKGSCERERKNCRIFDRSSVS